MRAAVSAPRSRRRQPSLRASVRVSRARERPPPARFAPDSNSSLIDGRGVRPELSGGRPTVEASVKLGQQWRE